MSFDSLKFGKVTHTDSYALQAIYSYADTTVDTLSTIMASGFFNNFINELKMNDLIYLVGTDDYALVRVTSVTTNVTVSEYAVASLDDGIVTNVKVNAAAAIDFSKLAALTSANVLVGSATNVPTAVAVSGDIALSDAGVTLINNNAVTSIKIVDANVTKAKLAAGINASHMVVYAGEHTTVGGAAAEAISVAGVLATDLVFVQLKAQGAAPQTVLIAVPTADTVTVTFSADPSNDHIVYYQVVRATS